MAIHPCIKNLQDAVRKKEITSEKINIFKKWMNNPKKFKEEYKEEAEQVLLEAEKLMQSGQGDWGYKQLQQKSQSSREKSYYGGKQKQEKYMNYSAADAKVLGSPFHNPYTFIPFPTKAPERKKPTPLSIDEKETDRLSGILRVKLQTLSPLLTPEKKGGKEDSKTPLLVPALKINKDIIVPASSVRGVLRTLTAIISGSALDYVDDELYLCQGRDLQLKEPLYLAEVISPGSRYEDGEVAFNQAKLIESSRLSELLNCPKELSKETRPIWLDESLTSAQYQEDEDHPYRVKVSGRKVNSKNPHEGYFCRSTARKITLRKELWKEYGGRHRNATKTGLQKGDLVWLEPYDQEKGIKDGSDVKSIQWARWGRKGVNFFEKLNERLSYMLPDSLKNDGLVDITSDLFGSIPMPAQEAVASYDAFAARIRPENLVFQNAGTFWNEMPVLGMPHPGCKAFYLNNPDYDKISLEDLPRGYKVYRTSKHDLGQEPWKYSNQPIFNNPENAKPFQDTKNLTRKCELINQNTTGVMNISFRALNRKELSLLLLVLSCDLRIGGGKPLGLGHCKVTEIKGVSEDGVEFLCYQPQRASLPNGQFELPEDYIERAKLYCKTQVPVSMMRYPRAINGLQRGGMCYFSYFAEPKKGGIGLEAVGCEGNLEQKIGNNLIRAQGLPFFDPTDPESDELFGYDLNGRFSSKKQQKNFYSGFDNDTKSQGQKNENNSPNRFSRQWARDKR